MCIDGCIILAVLLVVASLKKLKAEAAKAAASKSLLSSLEQSKVSSSVTAYVLYSHTDICMYHM